MTNMMRTYGKKAAGLTLLGDALKAVVACIIGYALLGHLGSYLAGLFCILGHIFPAFYKFKGGKGVVTTAISILMCDPIVFAILITLFIIIVAFTRYISLGSVICVMLYPILLDRINHFFTGSATPYAVFAIFIAILVVFKHWTNIKRLLQGKESKFSFKKSVKTPEENGTEGK
jgi:glycerol-3-phosphate acyltransferase PlsY